MSDEKGSKVRAIAPDGAPSPLGLRPEPVPVSAIRRVSTIARDFDLTALMQRENIAKVETYLHLFSVVLKDGRFGVGETVGEALDKAKKPDAENVRRMVA
jgi:hypothetical protein